MRNFDAEVKELLREIKALKLAKKEKEIQLRAVRREHREVLKSKESYRTKDDDILRDHFGKPISIGDWVSVITKEGVLISTEGTVIKKKKWVTFLSTRGGKQFKAPYNLVVSATSEN